MIADLALIIVGTGTAILTLAHMRRRSVVDLRSVVAAHTAPVGRP